MELPDLYHIEYLTEAASNGDAEAAKELGQINERLARAANQRLRRLEKAGKTNDAYKRIVEELGGRKRLMQHNRVTDETAASIGRNAERALRALKMKETTITSIKETDRKTVESLMKHFNMDDRDVSDEEINRFNMMMSSEVWPEVRKRAGTGGIQDMLDYVLDGGDMAQVVRAFEEWYQTLNEAKAGGDEEEIREAQAAFYDTWAEFF